MEEEKNEVDEEENEDVDGERTSGRRWRIIKESRKIGRTRRRRGRKRSRTTTITSAAA